MNEDTHGEEELTDTPKAPPAAAAKNPGSPVEAGIDGPERGHGNEDAEEEFALPEGFTPSDYSDRFAEVASHLKLGSREAGTLMAFWAEVAKDVEDSRVDAWNDARRHWAHATMRDREMGGKNLSSTVGYAATAVNTFGTEGLKEVFRATGLGNHPEVVRFMAKVGRAMAEDPLLTGQPGGHGGPKSAAELIYGRK